MPKRTDINKVLIIGSGPIIIGQACEFDYSGTQACKALRKLGYEIVLVNSNPATIMTDPETADVTYIEPLNVERLEQIIAKERPDAVIHFAGLKAVGESCEKPIEYYHNNMTGTFILLRVMKEHGVKEEYKWVCENFDALLAELGYHRDGKLYRVEKENNDTFVFFCHFGLECVLLSHLLSVSPMILWHGTCAQPSSVTTLVTEEREEGIAFFRMLNFGDVSHLTENGEEPSFMARFCEVYTDFSQQH
mgnify:CR=1 FL=1